MSNIAFEAIYNLVTHASWIHERLSSMHVKKHIDLVLVDCGLPCDTFNLICRTRLHSDTAPDKIEKAIAYFAKVSRPFSWWLNPGDQPSNLRDLLLAAGLHEAETELAMVADLNNLQSADIAPNGLEIRAVKTEAQLQDFAKIVAANWEPSDTEVIQFYDLASEVVFTETTPFCFYVGYLDDKPVAAAEMTISNDVVGLYSICTLAAHRQQGFGTAMTLKPLLHARELGYQKAVLQASEAGSRIYAQLGFEPFGHITEFKP